MSEATLQSWIAFKTYRLSTVLKSFKTLYSLSPEKIDAFLNSYNIYDHDWVNEEQLIANMGADYYQEIKRKLIDYYSVLNHLCAIGQVEKMYIPPAMDLSVSIIANQKLFEQRMNRDLGLYKGCKVLDIGCGRGRVANHMASMSGAEVTGMNIDPDQIESARRFAAGKNMSHQCQFKISDMNDIPFPFPDQAFDFIYEIQVFSLSKNFEKLFKELHRLLKPGGKIALLEWVCFDKYEATNPHHADLMRRIKPLIGAIGCPTVAMYEEAFRKAGFEVLISENASIDGLQAPLIENADRFFTRISRLIKFLVGSKILPKHFQTLFNRLTKDGQALIEADRLRLVTTTYYFVAQKK